MKLTTKHSVRAARPKTFSLGAFQRDEDGALTLAAIAVIMGLVVIAGVSVDLMAQEMERSRVQNTADRAVLAAADLDQESDPETIVRQYFEMSGLTGYDTSVSIQEAVNFRTASVNVSKNIDTRFMSLVGHDTLPVRALATAEENIPKVEISLALDTTTSMAAGTRLPDLQAAASGFIDTVLADDVSRATSVSLVPYGGQVNPGPAMFDYIGAERLPATPLDEALGGIAEHLSHGVLDASAEAGVGIYADDTTRYVYPNVSSCPEIHTSGFNMATLPPYAAYTQTPYFSIWNDNHTTSKDVSWCPDDEFAIKYLSNDREGLKETINNFKLYDGTGTQYAMQWSMALLDPSSAQAMSDLASPLQISSEFIGRPSSYDDSNTIKYIILMTDGGISVQYRPNDEFNENNVLQKMAGTRVSHRYTLAGKDENFARFDELCDLAKSRSPRPIIVYTIAFETRNAQQADAMRDCASSPSHFFATDGENISDVFASIARQINQLRLTQ